jgi:hypothetical protein
MNGRLYDDDLQFRKQNTERRVIRNVYDAIAIR